MDRDTAVFGVGNIRASTSHSYDEPRRRRPRSNPCNFALRGFLHTPSRGRWPTLGGNRRRSWITFSAPGSTGLERGHVECLTTTLDGPCLLSTQGEHGNPWRPQACQPYHWLDFESDGFLSLVLTDCSFYDSITTASFLLL